VAVEVGQLAQVEHVVLSGDEMRQRVEGRMGLGPLEAKHRHLGVRTQEHRHLVRLKVRLRVRLRLRVLALP